MGEKMTSHKEPEHDEGYPICVYRQLFRPMELQVQRPWGREVPTTQGTSKEARGWTLKVREGLVWKMIMCSASKTCSELVFYLRETECYVASCIMRTTVLGV